MAQTPPRYDHRDAYRKLHDAIMNPAAREGAKNDLVVGPILKKLSLRDLDRLKEIAQNDQVSAAPGCNPHPPAPKR
jgi:hypothetical protein